MSDDPMSAFTLLDLVLLGALAFGGWRGLRTGAMRQVVGLMGAVVGFWVAAVLMDPAGELIVASLGLSERVAPVVGFIVVFAAALSALAAVSHVARKTLESLKMGFLDKAVGAVLGGTQAAVLLSILLIAGGGLIGSLLLDGEARDQSVLFEPVQAVAPALWEGFRSLAPGWQDALVEKFNLLSGHDDA